MTTEEKVNPRLQAPDLSEVVHWVPDPDPPDWDGYVAVCGWVTGGEIVSKPTAICSMCEMVMEQWTSG